MLNLVFLNHMQENKGRVYAQCILKQMYVTFLTELQGDCPNCKHALRPNKFEKEAVQQASPCKPLPCAATKRKPNVSLADLRRCCPFTQGHSGLFHFLVVFILRFVKTGTPTPLSSNIRSDPAP